MGTFDDPRELELRDRLEYLVVHCSATPPSMDIGVREIRKWHMARGWLDVGYHFVIKRDGSLEIGRPVWKSGAHAYGVNGKSIGICLIGGVEKVKGSRDVIPTDNFTPAQKAELFELLTDLRIKFGDVEVIGHRDVPGTKKACPSFDVKRWWSHHNQ